MTITAAADGSALGNPGPAGWAWYIDDRTWRAGGWPHGTNNMGELKAVLDLLEATAVDADQHLHVLCDSQYVINSVTKWMPGWKRKGWRKKDGKPVMNVDLLKAIDRALAGRSVEFEWVKGHAGHRMNEAADRRANGAAVAFSKKQDPEVGPGYGASGGSGDGGRATGSSGATGSTGSAPAPRLCLTPDSSAPADPGADSASAASAGAAPAASPADDLFSLFDADSAGPERSGAGADDAQGSDGPSARSSADPDSAPFEEIVAREQVLLSDLLRKNPERAAELLHPDFTEIGTSGRAYDREQVLAVLAPVPGLRAREFIAEEVSDGVVLLRFVTSDARGTQRRSSLWVRVDGTWLLRHHQSTPDPQGAPGA
ncbi:ribonuclease HI family protein [Brachybacterium sp. MASK1Z-5]|uniref:Ribonuclease H n=1 Tax=Brachybacterium halotolerans TaxID=2795215 RepID=A0ABS1BD65_9MICO|nr:ribonuclease HI family protein [Brachybacterium halotolerans]MBK0332549.1 ribonuclease HI family protein [Brachybacterium halotolerans]